MVNFEHIALAERIDVLISLRKAYEMLRDVVVKVLGVEERESPAIGEINTAYHVFSTLDVLDLSREGR